MHPLEPSSMLHQLMSRPTQRRPRPVLPLQPALFSTDGLHIFPLMGETPAERMMLSREAQEASSDQAAAELLSDEVVANPSRSPATRKGKEGQTREVSCDSVRDGTAESPGRDTSTGHTKFNHCLAEIRS